MGQLARFGPIDPTNGFPTWYQDKTGVTMDLCLPQTQAEMTWCLLPPIPNGPPEVFPTNWAIENFYSSVSAGGTNGGASMKLIMDLETSFANGFNVIPGDQVAFGRTRIKISPLPFSGDYTVYTPVGKFVFPNQAAGDRLFFTEDIGLAAAGNFSAALNSRIGPFMLPSTAPGGPELPPIPLLQPGQDPFYDALVAAGGTTAYPGNGRKYIADPGRLGPITGGKTNIAGQTVYTVNDGTTRDPNIFRVEGPSGFVFETTSFNVMGRVFEGAIAGQAKVDRASYARTAAGATTVDVYATAQPSSQARIPASPPAATVATTMSFYDTPCTATLDAAGNPGPPYSAPASGTPIPMGNSGAQYFGSSNPASPALQVCVASNAVNAAGQTITTYTPAPLGDQVFISQAIYDKTTQAMSVSAASSDQLLLPALTLDGYGPIPASGTVVVGSLLAPPATVNVLSAATGSNSMQMSDGSVANPNPTPQPIAVNDAPPAINENCSPTATTTACAAPVSINVLGNDTNASGGTVTIASAPTLGTASVNPDGTIAYTPNLNAWGTDTLTYNVTVGTQISNNASVTITITHINQAPTANNDSSGALRGVQNSINVLANDTDPDGAADLGSALIATGNASLGVTAGTSFVGGNVTFTPPSTSAAGTYTFTYFAVDKAGLQSATPATVTVTLSTSEAIVPAKTIYTQAKGRWTNSGTVSPAAGQTITMSYVDGTYKVSGACTGNSAGIVVGTAKADALGNWLFDQILTSTAGVLNPSNTGGNSTGFWCTPPKTMKYSSSLSTATASQAISLK